jgi:amino acid transporter
MPFGVKSVLLSVVSCGVVMAFNGFQSPLNFSEEIENPRTMLLIAVLGSIIITFIIYVLLQVVFVGSLSPEVLAHGWANVNMRSPFVDLLLALNLQVMVISVYANSIVSPSATGALFIASSSRILYSLANQKHLPSFLCQLHPLYYNPRKAIITSTILGSLFLLVFKGWYQLVAVISVIHLFTYLPLPVVVMANRIKNKSILSKKGQFIMPLGKLVSPILMLGLSLLLFSAEWPLTGEMLLFILPGLGFYMYYEYKNHRGKGFMQALKGASWLIFYIVGVSLIAYLGNDPAHSSQDISNTESYIAIAVLTIFTYIFGVYYTIDYSDDLVPHNGAVE